MAELGDVTGGDVITSAFTNDVKNRTIMRYTSAAARDASIPTPVEGDLAFLADQNTITYYAGSYWRTIVTSDGVVAIGGTLTVDALVSLGVITSTGQITSGGDINVYTSAADDASVRFRKGGSASGTGFAITDEGDKMVIFDYEDGVTSLERLNGRTESFQLRGGGWTSEYTTSSPDGSGIYHFQYRNIIVSENVPSAATGKNGDVCIQYQNAGDAQNTPCNVWVKVNGAWRGMS